MVARGPLCGRFSPPFGRGGLMRLCDHFCFLCQPQHIEYQRDATVAHLHREDADFAFHSAIAKATNNHYYVSSMTALKDHIFVGMKFHGVSLTSAYRGLENVFGEHRAIYEAIRARDAARARDLMRRHLEGSRNRVFEGRLLDLRL